MMDLQLDGKRALVTGASRGIGRAIALALADEGVRVVAGHHRPSEEADRLAEQLSSAEGHVVAADVSSADGVAALLARCQDALGGLDVIVNAAGVIEPGPLGDVRLETWQAHIDTNLTGTHLVVQGALPLLAEGASIVNIGSGMAFAGMPARAAYAASKAGLTGLTRSLIRELGSRGIRVNVISPGLVDTEMATSQPEEARRRFEMVSALHRLGHPRDIASVVLFLVSPLSGWVNGVTLPVDGGV
jgi:NAD(P)-dependent dehydrogenase (short-subunit alcohol dehydrogenase family)